MAKLTWGLPRDEPDENDSAEIPDEESDEPSSVEETAEPEPAAPVRSVQDDTVMVELPGGKRKRVSAAMASFLVSRRGAKRIG